VLLGIVRCGLIVKRVKARRDGWPFAGAVLLFLSAFGTLAVSFISYMIPFTITIEKAAAPHSSLAFMFWGAGLIVMPFTLI